ncbi:MAG: carotenoid biosynthesis protein [Nitrolancea sp.]
MTTIRSLFGGHLIALAFGLGGLLIALPHPELWSGSRFAAQVFSFGMTYAGSLHIILGAATMLAFGCVFLGFRRTSIFFVVTVCCSLSAELIGTGTGWPFGNYAYTDGLGLKVLGRVPFTIPLSWFLIGFSAYLLGNVLAATRIKRHQAVWAVAFGAYLLTVWDLVLDPAMASSSMPIRFWTWFESGPYFGMPIQNFVGWTLTGVLFMTISRLLWRRPADVSEFPAWVPLSIYLANMGFAMALSLSVGLWQPTLAAIIFGCVPALYAWWTQHTADPAIPMQPAMPPRTVSETMMRSGARLIASLKLDLAVEGEANVPSRGPVVLVCRHYHHFYDGVALLAQSPRHLHILVALDWIERRPPRHLMERLCRLAGWPVILRPEVAGRSQRSAYRSTERFAYLRRAAGEVDNLLRSDKALVIFPEGYPTIDPTFTPKQGANEFLPFQSGFLRLIEHAQRDGSIVPIIPVGLAYETGDRARLTLRFGSPVLMRHSDDRARVLSEIEQSVRTLSLPSIPLERSFVQEAIQP